MSFLFSKELANNAILLQGSYSFEWTYLYLNSHTLTFSVEQNLSKLDSLVGIPRVVT